MLYDFLSQQNYKKLRSICYHNSRLQKDLQNITRLAEATVLEATYLQSL
jgi:hypothetical protein